MGIKSRYKILFLFLISLIISLTTISVTSLAQDVSVTHTFTSSADYFGEKIPVAGTMQITASVTNRVNVKDISIILDDKISLTKCTLDKCIETIFVDGGLHTYYAIITKSDGTIETTTRTDVLVAQSNCISSNIKITGPSKKLLYAVANSKQVYEVEVKNPTGELDSFSLGLSGTRGNWKGSFSENPITLNKDESKKVLLTIEPDTAFQNDFLFFVDVRSQLQKTFTYNCIYYFFGHSINIESISEGIILIPDQKSISNILIPSSRTLSLGSEVELTAQVKQDYNFLGWLINGESRQDMKVSLKMDKDWNVKLSSNTKDFICRGTYSLSFHPDKSLPSHAGTSSVSGFTHNVCGRKIVNILDSNNNPACSCNIDTFSQQGCRCDFISSNTEGTHSYTAKVDRNNDGDFNDVFFGEPESVKANMIVSSSVTPSCKFFDTPKKKTGQEKIYGLQVNVYNLPTDLKKIKLICDKTFPIEQIIGLKSDIDQSSSIPLTCDYTHLTQPKEITVSVSAPTMPECTTAITDFLPEQLSSITLFPGWNFISTPYSEGGRIKFSFDRFCNMERTIGLDPLTKRFQFIGFDEIQTNRGYFVKVKNQCTASFSDTPSSTTTFHNGWNFFGVRTISDQSISLSQLEKKIAKNCFPALQVNPKPFQSSIIQLNPVTKRFIFDPAELRSGFGYAVKLFMATSPCEITFEPGRIEITNTKTSKEETGAIDKYTFEISVSNTGDSSVTQDNVKFRIYSPQKDTGEKDDKGNPIFVRLKLCTFELGTLTLAPGESRKQSCEYEASKAESEHTIISKHSGTVYETFPSGHEEKTVSKFPELAQNKITLPLSSSDIGIRLGEGVAFRETLVIYI